MAWKKYKKIIALIVIIGLLGSFLPPKITRAAMPVKEVSFWELVGLQVLSLLIPLISLIKGISSKAVDQAEDVAEMASMKMPGPEVDLQLLTPASIDIATSTGTKQIEFLAIPSFFKNDSSKLYYTWEIDDDQIPDKGKKRYQALAAGGSIKNEYGELEKGAGFEDKPLLEMLAKMVSERYTRTLEDESIDKQELIKQRYRDITGGEEPEDLLSAAYAVWAYDHGVQGGPEDDDDNDGWPDQEDYPQGAPFGGADGSGGEAGPLGGPNQCLLEALVKRTLCRGSCAIGVDLEAKITECLPEPVENLKGCLDMEDALENCNDVQNQMKKAEAECVTQCRKDQSYADCEYEECKDKEDGLILKPKKSCCEKNCADCVGCEEDVQVEGMCVKRYCLRKLLNLFTSPCEETFSSDFCQCKEGSPWGGDNCQCPLDYPEAYCKSCLEKEKDQTCLVNGETKPFCYYAEEGQLTPTDTCLDAYPRWYCLSQKCIEEKGKEYCYTAEEVRRATDCCLAMYPQKYCEGQSLSPTEACGFNFRKGVVDCSAGWGCLDKACKNECQLMYSDCLYHFGPDYCSGAGVSFCQSPDCWSVHDSDPTDGLEEGRDWCVKEDGSPTDKCSAYYNCYKFCQSDECQYQFGEDYCGLTECQDKQNEYCPSEECLKDHNSPSDEPEKYKLLCAAKNLACQAGCVDEETCLIKQWVQTCLDISQPYYSACVTECNVDINCALDPICLIQKLFYCPIACAYYIWDYFKECVPEQRVNCFYQCEADYESALWGCYMTGSGCFYRRLDVAGTEEDFDTTIPCHHLFPQPVIPLESIDDRAALLKSLDYQTGDGKFTNWEEFIWGTDPTDPDTDDDGQVDEADIVGVGEDTLTIPLTPENKELLGFFEAFPPKLKIKVIVEGTTLVPTGETTTYYKIMWAEKKGKFSFEITKPEITLSVEPSSPQIYQVVSVSASVSGISTEPDSLIFNWSLKRPTGETETESNLGQESFSFVPSTDGEYRVWLEVSQPGISQARAGRAAIVIEVKAVIDVTLSPANALWGDIIEITAENPFGDHDVSYIWYLDGRKQETTGNVTILLITKQPGQSHFVRLSAIDIDSFKKIVQDIEIPVWSPGVWITAPGQGEDGSPINEAIQLTEDEQVLNVLKDETAETSPIISLKAIPQPEQSSFALSETIKYTWAIDGINVMEDPTSPAEVNDDWLILPIYKSVGENYLIGVTAEDKDTNRTASDEITLQVVSTSTQPIARYQSGPPSLTDFRHKFLSFVLAPIRLAGQATASILGALLPPY